MVGVSSWLIGSALLLPLGLIFIFRHPSRRSPPRQSPTFPPSRSKSLGSPLPSVLAPAYTTHARLLPSPSRHAFSYPLLYIGADIDSLTDGSIDQPFRLFSFGGKPWTKVLGLRSDGYLTPGPDNLREKVEVLLRKQCGIGREGVGRVWVLTMPSLCGFEGINPLTVWYVYKAGSGIEAQEKGDRALLAVILEVHNTFGEKHAYVLPTTSPFITTPKEGYTHAWTFPRGFHVSPFNTRDGYYILDLIDPFASARSSSSTNTSSSTSSYPDAPMTTDSTPHHDVRLPQFKVFLRLLTPAKETKLHALLASSSSTPPVPLRSSSPDSWRIARTIMKWPLALILTTPRILIQAYKLHYEKKLAVYPRPEPGAEDGEAESLGREVKDEFNPPHVQAKQSGRAIEWQPVSFGERWARDAVTRYLDLRCREERIGVRVEFTYPVETLVITGEADADEASPNDKSRDQGAGGGFCSDRAESHRQQQQQQLVIRTTDPKLFTHLLLLPSPIHFLLLAPEFGTQIPPSSHTTFKRLFSISTTTIAIEKDHSAQSTPPRDHPLLVKIARRIRRTYFLNFLALHSHLTPTPEHIHAIDTSHFIDHLPLLLPLILRIKVMFAIYLLSFTDQLEEKIMRMAGAVFVQGQEPWTVLERALKREKERVDALRTGQGRGAVLRRGGVKAGHHSSEVKGKGDAETRTVESESESSDSSDSTTALRGRSDDEWVDLGSARYD